MQRALHAAGGKLAGRTYQAMGLVAGALLHAGFPCRPAPCCKCRPTLPPRTIAGRWKCSRR